MYVLKSRVKYPQTFVITEPVTSRHIASTVVPGEKKGTYVEKPVVTERKGKKIKGTVEVPPTFDAKNPGIVEISNERYEWLVKNDQFFAACLRDEDDRNGRATIRASKQP